MITANLLSEFGVPDNVRDVCSEHEKRAQWSRVEAKGASRQLCPLTGVGTYAGNDAAQLHGFFYYP